MRTFYLYVMFFYTKDSVVIAPFFLGRDFLIETRDHKGLSVRKFMICLPLSLRSVFTIMNSVIIAPLWVATFLIVLICTCVKRKVMYFYGKNHTQDHTHDMICNILYIYKRKQNMKLAPSFWHQKHPVSVGRSVYTTTTASTKEREGLFPSFLTTKHSIHLRYSHFKHGNTTLKASEREETRLQCIQWKPNKNIYITTTQYSSTVYPSKDRQIDWIVYWTLYIFQTFI